MMLEMQYDWKLIKLARLNIIHDKILEMKRKSWREKNAE